jgi:hypothetical protein
MGPWFMGGVVQHEVFWVLGVGVVYLVLERWAEWVVAGVSSGFAADTEELVSVGTVVGPVSLTTCGASVVGGGTSFGSMSVALTFDTSYGVSFLLPGVKFHFCNDYAVSEEGVSGGRVVEDEYRVSNSLFS